MDSIHLSVKDLSCARNEFLLFERLGFEIGLGDILLLEGPNGSGKTSLLRLLAGLATPESGQVLWQNKAINAIRYEFNQAMIYIGHASGVKDGLSVDENLCWLAPGFNQQQRLAALAKAGLTAYEDQLCARLSAGQRRKVSLARLYLESKPLWILDEPFTALDKNSVESVENLLIEHSQKGGMAILTTHQDFNLEGVSVRRLFLKDFLPLESPPLETGEAL